MKDFMMEKLTMKAYAKKHKLSLFNVVKMVKAGKVRSESVLEEGKDVLYIVMDDVLEEEVESKIEYSKDKTPHSMRKENERLKKRIKELEDEIKKLKHTQYAEKPIYVRVFIRYLLLFTLYLAMAVLKNL